MTVVAAYSADAYGEAALDHAIDEVTSTGERLVVVNVTRGDALVDPRFAGTAGAAAVGERLAGLPGETELVQTMAADVAEEILSVTEREAGRLLVVGVRHRSPVGKLIMGSVAQRLILEAHCPVLAVKPVVAVEPHRHPTP